MVVEPGALTLAGERAAPRDTVVSASVAKNPVQRSVKDERSTAGTVLDRVAYAVDGAESSHGADPAMWGLELSGPQGPMQVTEAAAADVGGGDRFDLIQNRAIGRDYLALLFRRYNNWPDAIVAYNWGMGNVDAWIRAGRPAENFLVGVAVYLRRVLRDSGMCNRAVPVTARHPTPHPPEEREFDAINSANAVCADFAAWGGLSIGADGHFFATSSHFRSKLDKAAQLAAQHFPAQQRLHP